MLKIAHRGNTNGPSDQENQLLYLFNAVKQGYGVETDLRRAPCGRLIISHDPAEWDPLNDAKLILRNLILKDAFIALNIKEEGMAEDLVKIIQPHHMRGFVFDFELWCSNAAEEKVAYLNAGFNIANRLSDRNTHIDGLGQYIWLDEMDQSGSVDLNKIFDMGWSVKEIIYVSPELHGRPLSEQRTESFFAVCTDYC